MIYFETERLVARPFDPEDDAEEALEIYGDPEVTRWIGGETSPDLDAMRRRLERARELFDPRGHPFCLAACFLRDGGALVGAGLLKKLPDADGHDTDEVEVGWHLMRKRWGHGYATEIGRALLERGFAALDVDAIYAVTDPPNDRSQAVARRCGMEHVGPTDRYYGKTLELFVKRRP